MVKASEIKNFIGNKQEPEKPCPEGEDCISCAYMDGWNDFRDGIGSRELTLNRERLARICHKNSGYGRGFGRKFDLMCASDQEVFYNEADAIIENLPTLLECKETE